MWSPSSATRRKRLGSPSDDGRPPDRGRPGHRRRGARGDARLRRGHPHRRRCTRSASRIATSRDVRRQRHAHRARPRCRHRRRHRRGSSTSRPSTSSATPTAGSSTSRTGGTSRDGFLSWYDETKYRAHEIAEARIAAGAPIVIVDAQPGLRAERPLDVRRAARPSPTPASCAIGRSMTSGIGLVHVDDLAAGIVAALDRGPVGRSYVLSGPRTTLARCHRARGDGSAAASRPRSDCRPGSSG